MNEDKLTSAQVRAEHRRRIKEDSERSTPNIRPQAAFSLARPLQALRALESFKGVNLMGQ
jgi:hypothetical protein